MKTIFEKMFGQLLVSTALSMYIFIQGIVPMYYISMILLPWEKSLPPLAPIPTSPGGSPHPTEAGYHPWPTFFRQQPCTAPNGK